MRVLNRIVVVMFLVAMTVSAETTTSQFVWTDGNTYVHTYTYDEATGTSYERHDLLELDGSTQFVASLFSDAEGNWAGRIGGFAYADQLDPTLGEYVVVEGAEWWPTWQDFDAALTTIGFWGPSLTYDGGIVIDGGIYYDEMAYALAIGTTTGETTQTSRGRGIVNALRRSDGHRDYRARLQLLESLDLGRGTPTQGNGK